MCERIVINILIEKCFATHYLTLCNGTCVKLDRLMCVNRMLDAKGIGRIICAEESIPQELKRKSSTTACVTFQNQIFSSLMQLRSH